MTTVFNVKTVQIAPTQKSSLSLFLSLVISQIPSIAFLTDTTNK